MAYRGVLTTHAQSNSPFELGPVIQDFMTTNNFPPYYTLTVSHGHAFPSPGPLTPPS